jgi:predicted metal-binding membrane protein
MDERRSDAISSTMSRAGMVWAALLAVSAGAWLITIRRADSMGNGTGTMGMAFPLFVGMWTAMMGAMMWPAITPTAIRNDDGIAQARIGALGAIRGLVFAAGFVLPWAVYGVVAFLALTGTGHLAESAPTAAKWLGVGILAIAGAYQFTPWKDRFLGHCHGRMMGYTDRGLLSGVRAGALEGTFCVGCCWAFMAMFLALGVMNVAAMVAIAAVIFAEKLLPLAGARTFARVVGLAFLALAVAAAVHPTILAGLHVSDMGMGTGGM